MHAEMTTSLGIFLTAATKRCILNLLPSPAVFRWILDKPTGDHRRPQSCITPKSRDITWHEHAADAASNNFSVGQWRDAQRLRVVSGKLGSLPQRRKK
jgi:hypothetical protein